MFPPAAGLNAEPLLYERLRHLFVIQNVPLLCVIAPTLDRAVGALFLSAKFGCSFSRPYYIGAQ